MAPPTKKGRTGCNISGLHNQNPPTKRKTVLEVVSEEETMTFFDSTHVDWEKDAETAEDSEPEDSLNDEDYGDEEFTKELMAMVMQKTETGYCPLYRKRSKSAVSKASMLLPVAHQFTPCRTS